MPLKIKLILGGLLIAIFLPIIGVTMMYFRLEKKLEQKLEQKYGGFSANPSIANPFTVVPTQGGRAATTTEFFGSINPRIDAAYDIGTSTRRWNRLFLSGAASFAGGATFNTLTVTGQATVGSLSSSGAVTGTSFLAANTVVFGVNAGTVATGTRTAVTSTISYPGRFCQAAVSTTGTMQFITIAQGGFVFSDIPCTP